MAHYFDAEPTVASAPGSVRLDLPDVSLHLATDAGVFARSQVDPGTKLLLLEGPPVPATGDVVDLGCGYGPIAITLARRSPGATVWAVDVNRRARELTAANAEAAGVVNLVVVAPEEVPAGLMVAAVWSNPPVRVGKQAMHELLLTWLRRLRPDGQAALVVQKHLGADSLAAWLVQQGYEVDRLRSRMGYRLLAIRPVAMPPGTPVE